VPNNFWAGHFSYFTEIQVAPSALNGSLGAGTTVTREEQERLSTPLHIHVDPVSFLHRNFDKWRLIAHFTSLLCVRFQVFTTVSEEYSLVGLDTMSLVEIYQHVRWMYCLHLQDCRLRWESWKHLLGSFGSRHETFAENNWTLWGNYSSYCCRREKLLIKSGNRLVEWCWYSYRSRPIGWYTSH
jgi:hypothetical protein